MKKISLFLFLLSSFAYAKRYQRYLSAQNIEEDLSQVVLKPRLKNEEWLGLLGDKKNQKYQVVAGDSLWLISQKVFGDPFLWRKLWQVNGVISNPHVIEPGSLLAYYSEDQNSIPVVKLKPPSRGVAADLENDIVVNQAISSRLRIPLFVIKDKDILGEVSGSYSEKNLLSYLDDPYLKFENPSQVKVGDIFSVAREESNISKKLKSDWANGTLMRLVGQVKVVEVGEQLVKGEIVGNFYTLQRGDKIVSHQKMANRAGVFSPPEELMATVVAGEEPGHQVFGQGELIILNKGETAGMQEGFYFRVFRDTDPNTKSRKTVEPHYKGEVSIVYVAENMSVGYITRNHDIIQPGDVLVPYKSFNEPPRRPRRETEQVDLD